jgi:hypothetical protein
MSKENAVLKLAHGAWSLCTAILLMSGHGLFYRLLRALHLTSAAPKIAWVKLERAAKDFDEGVAEWKRGG